MNPNIASNKQPKVSIIIPTFNRADYLQEAIESVLQQDYANLEIIITDNASEDNTREVINKYIEDDRVKYFRNDENIGMVNNWKKALTNHVNGSWFVILSDDDFFIDSSYIQKAIKLAQTDEEVAIVYSNGYIEYTKDGSRSTLEVPFSGVVDGIEVFLSRGKVLPQDFTLCNILFNFEKSIALNPFSNPDNVACDSELFLKLCLRGKVGVINDYTSVYRIHGDNLAYKVVEDFNLFSNHLDFLITPYLDSLENKKMNTHDCDIFKYNCLIPAMKFFLIRTATIHNDRVHEAEERVFNIGHNIGNEILSISNFSFYVKYMIRKKMLKPYLFWRKIRGRKNKD